MGHLRIVAALLLLPLVAAAHTPSVAVAPEAGGGWADSVLHTLTLEQKIAQLIMVRVHSNKNRAYNDTAVARMGRYQWGGVCFFQAYPVCQAILTNRLQAASHIPVMVAIDGEWGLGMRLDSILLYPRQMALGASRDTDAIYEMGRQMALQCHRIGVHCNFAPDVDINNNPRNPVINSRSFGSDPYWVSRCGIAYMRGMQENGLLTTAKHFPGHGDTETDSHAATPTITHSRRHLQKMELQPFGELIRAGVDGVMVGHLHVPALDSERIATVSSKIMRDLLRDELGFRGLICTDALEMKGISTLYPAGEMEVQVLLAGADLLLLPSDPMLALQKIKEAVESGVLPVEVIDEHCLNILKAKEKYVLPYAGRVEPRGLVGDINSPEAKAVSRRLTESSLTLLRNRHHTVPLHEGLNRVAHLRIDASGQQVLDTFFRNRYGTKTFRVTPKQAADTHLLRPFFREADSAELLVVTLSCLSQYPEKNNYGMLPQIVRLLDTLSRHRRVLLVVMGNPYALNALPSAHHMTAVLLAYHPTVQAEQAVADVLAHRLPVRGRLPVQLDDFDEGDGVQIVMAPMLRPASGDTKLRLDRIDTLVRRGLDAGAYPGCQVLVAKNGDILYEKAFGTYSYDDRRPVTMETVYDLASVTKCMATTLAIMKLYDMGKIRLDAPLSEYLPYLAGSNKAKLTVAEVMTHTAGLRDWIPFYQRWGKEIYRPDSSGEYSVPVCRGMYMRADYRDSIRKGIADSPLAKEKKYKYSDLGFYLLADAVRMISGLPLDSFMQQQFYGPMGLQATCFNPWRTLPLSRVAPTENDVKFRQQLVHGYVHDQGAAMMGGVCGHAGLFSTAGEIAQLLQMLLNGGVYRGVTYFSPQTVKLFTSYYAPNVCRRGLGFDKPSLSGPSPCGRLASPESFGHSGFTGTFFWVDPKYGLVYVFLSNRVCPDASNTKLSSMNIRTDIQDYVCQVIGKAMEKDSAEAGKDNEKSATFAAPNRSRHSRRTH